MKELKVGDIVNPYGKVTRVSDFYVWIGNKRYKPKTLENKEIHFLKSPNTIVDWTNEKEVDAYYISFNVWATAIRMGDERKYEILEVKNNKIFYEGEYYLPFKYVNSIGGKATYEDGYIFGFCIKKTNAWYDSMEGEIVNIFMVEKVLEKDIIKKHEAKIYAKKTLDNAAYLKAIDFMRLTNKDLNLLKTKFKDLFFEGLIPYTYKAEKSVVFGKGQFADIQVSHRNRQGYIRIENGYYGQQPFKEDYYAIVEIVPYFTNEMRYYVRVEYADITFDKSMLDKLAKNLIPIWDKAIERNASNRYM